MDATTLRAAVERLWEALPPAEALQDAVACEALRQRYVSRKGELATLFVHFRALSTDQKKALAPRLNELKAAAIERLRQAATFSANDASGQASAAPPLATPFVDVTLPPMRTPLGARHPLQHVRTQLEEHFQRLGFECANGPEIETDWYNFTALNFPPHHPARDMQDTFFLARNPDTLLRTHTSSVQIRMMECHPPPLRMIMAGRVYRNEAITARSHCFFHQLEGLYIDQEVSFLDMKQTLVQFVKAYFGAKTPLRFRPSYFPFTEPSAELDISCLSCAGAGCGLCKHSGWLEVAGCGMVDPAVLQNCNIDPSRFSGYAFGMGLDRITMLRYGIDDIRLLYEGDMRFLQQFKRHSHLS